MWLAVLVRVACAIFSPQEDGPARAMERFLEEIVGLPLPEAFQNVSLKVKDKEACLSKGLRPKLKSSLPTVVKEQVEGQAALVAESESQILSLLAGARGTLQALFHAYGNGPSDAGRFVGLDALSIKPPALRALLADVFSPRHKEGAPVLQCDVITLAAATRGTKLTRHTIYYRHGWSGGDE